jgi:hypothetical protein
LPLGSIISSAATCLNLHLPRLFTDGQKGSLRYEGNQWGRFRDSCKKFKRWRVAKMGIDMKVMASHFRERGNELLPTATLRFDRDSGLFAQLTPEANPCLVHQLPQGLKVGCYEDNGLTFTDVDRYKQPLTFTTPAELRRLKAPEDIHPWNHAVLAFLLALPPDARIVLYWC